MNIIKNQIDCLSEKNLKQQSIMMIIYMKRINP